MAESVIDILTRLSYDVKADDLTKVIDQLKQQSAILVDLNSKVELYEANLKAAAATDINTQKQIQAELNRTKAARDNVAASIVNTVKNSSQAQQALKAEIGIIGNLTEKLDALKRSRYAALNVEDIKKYNEQIKATQSELSKLTTTNDSIFGNLLGSGGVGRQVLQGALYGFGVGGGFGIITRAVSAMIDFGKAAYESLTKASETADSFLSRMNAVNDALTKTLDEIGQFNDKPLVLGSNIIIGDRLDTEKRLLDLKKAQNIANGEIYKSEKDINDQTILTQKLELTDLERRKKLYTELSNLSKNDEGGRVGLRDIKEFANKQYGTSELDRKKAIALYDQLSGRSVDENGKETFSHPDIELIANDNLGKIKKQIDDQNQLIHDTEVSFNSKLGEQIYELNLSLLEKVRKSEEQYNLLKRKDAVETSDLILERLQLERDESLAALNDEITQARKNGLLTADNIKQFNNLRSLVNATFNTNFKQQNSDFIQSNLLQRNQNTAGLNKTDASQSAFNISDALQKGNIADFSEYEKNVRTNNEILVDDFISYYAQQYEVARKAGIDLEELDKRYAQDYQDILRKQNTNALATYQKYYLDLAKLIQNETQDLLLKVDLAGADDVEKLSERLRRGLSTEKYNRLKNLSGLRTGISEDATNISGTSTQLTAARDNLSSLQANPTASRQDISNAQIEINKLQLQLDKFNTDLNEKENAIKDLQKELIVQQIDGYQSLVDAAINAYQAINAAHEKYLDTEIGIQTERVREAEVLAQRGNTVALQQQSDLLKKEQQQKELYAKRDLEINAALTVSNSILTIAKAAVEGGAGAAFTIAAALIALGVGIVEATQLGTQNTPSFATGGFTGHGGKYEAAGTVHKGEFVTNSEHTAKYRPLLEAIHHGYDPIPVLAHNNSQTYHVPASKADFAHLARLMKENTEAVLSSKTEVNAHFDEHGMGIATQRAISTNARRYKG